MPKSLAFDSSFLIEIGEGNKKASEVLEKFKDHIKNISPYTLFELAKKIPKGDDIFTTTQNITHMLSQAGRVGTIKFDDDNMFVEAGRFCKDSGLTHHDSLSIFPFMHKKINFFLTADRDFSEIGISKKNKGDYDEVAVRWNDYKITVIRLRKGIFKK